MAVIIENIHKPETHNLTTFERDCKASSMQQRLMLINMRYIKIRQLFVY